ncbi:MAG TPA: SBBP repeat-containing protein [Bryobacteraceae bacterium]
MNFLSAVALLLLGTLAQAGNVTAAFPLPGSGSVGAMQQDAGGNVYLAGNTATDAFVAKLSSLGAVLFRTTFGGSQADSVRAMAIAPDGAISVIGYTASLDFPLTPDAAQTQFVTNNQGFTGFFVKLDAGGKVRYSSYLNTNYSVPAGSSAPSFDPAGLTLDAAGAAYVTGGGSFVSTSGALPMVVNGGWIMKLDASGKIVFATGAIGGGRIALDRQGFIYVVGSADHSFKLPVTPGAFQTTVADSTCFGNPFFAFSCSHQYAVKLDPAAGKIIYATWISGALGASVAALAVDDAGNISVAGSTASRDYPVTPGAYQTANFATLHPRDTTSVFGGPSLVLPVTGYVTKLNSAGAGLIFSTYLGGSSVDSIGSMAIDSAGRIYLGGIASSPDFPGLPVVPNACRPSYVYPVPFVTRLSADGSSLTETQLAFGLTSGTGLVALDGQGKATAQMGGALAMLDLFAPSSPLVCATDAADFAPLSSVAPGQLVSLFGEGIGPDRPVQAQPKDGFIPVSLGFSGISVTFNGVPAPILYGSSGQVNVQVPYEVANLDSVTMKLQFGMTTSTAVFSVVPSQPSAFVQAVSYASCNGEIRESLLPVAVNADGSLSDCGNRAPRGTFVYVFLNGLGLAGGHPVTGAITTSDAPAISATAALNPLNTGFSTEPILVTPDVGQINSVWQAKIAIPSTSLGSSLQLALTVNGVAVRDSLVVWLK